MTSADQVNAILEQAALDVERARERQSSSSETRDSDRRDGRDRRTDRYDRERRDRDRQRERRLEFNGGRPRSRDNYRRRRDGSRPRSHRGIDADDDRDRFRRSDSRDRYPRRDERRRGDYYYPSGRARSRSPRRDRDRDNGRLDSYRRDRSRDRRRADDRVPDERRVARRTATPTPEPTEDDRDKRTIFVQQISARADSKNLREFFQTVGPVVEAQIVKDRVTGRSKGVGYVEFKSEESVAEAIQKTGQKLKGVPIIAQLTEAEKNRASRAAEAGNTAANNAIGANGAPFHRLYVGNIHFSVSEDDLKDIFSPYGELEQVTLQRDESNPGRSKGYGFVQYADPSNAKKALSEMNNFELAGRQIRVGLGGDRFTNESTQALLRNFNQNAQSFQGSAFSGAGGRGAYAGGSGGVFDRAHGRDDRGVGGASALDDTDVAGVNFKTYDRSKLMNALARTEDQQPTKKGAGPSVQARAPLLDKPAASKCIKIENAFDPTEELTTQGPNWVKELENEVKIECVAKYGEVVHISVDTISDGDIYVKFNTAAGGEKALQGLNGRSFNSRTIRASYVVDKIYHSLFPNAASKA